MKWVKLQHQRDDERKKRRAVLQKNLEIQRERKKRELKKFHKEDRPRKEALALKQKNEAEQLAKRRERNKKRIAARKKKQEDDKISAEKQKLDESSKSWKLSKKRAEEANKRQTEKHKKMHDEVVAKAKALGMSDKKIEETIKFDERNVSMTGSNSNQVRVRSEINKKHAAKMQREAKIKAHDEHIEAREERVDDANARASVELGLKRALRQELDDGTKMPFDYMIGLFKIRMGQAKGLDADSRRTGARVTDLFMSLDRDQSKSIGKDELTKYMKTNRIDLNSFQIDQVIERFDEMGKLDEDGEIPYSEFVECLTGKLS